MKKFVKVYYRLDEDDKIEIKIQLLKMKKSLRKCAKELKVSISYLSEILNGNRNITPHVVDQFEKVGIKLQVDFEKEDTK